MKLTTFKKELKKTGASYAQVEAAYDAAYDMSDAGLEQLIEREGEFKYVILRLCH